MSVFRPTQQQERNILVDALRGLALFAILLANVPFAENQVAHYGTGEFRIGSTELDNFLNAFFHLFIDKKFVSIFSMVFGFGFYIQLRRAEEKGIDFRRYFLVRMFLLLLIGSLHAYLIWFGDIIRDYAICGIALLRVYKWPLKRIFYSAVIFGVLITGIIFILNGALGLSDYTYDPAIISEHPVTESYTRYLSINARIDPFRNFIQDTPLTLVFAFGCMIFGFWMAKSGFFQPSEKFSNATPLLIISGILVGLPCSYLFWKITKGEIEITPALVWVPLLIVAGLLLQTFSYIAVFIKLFQKGWFKKIASFFEPVGRTALTNYIVQSLFYLFLFFHCTPGPGLYGKLTLTETYLLCIVLFSIQVLISRVWLKRFRQGPIEFWWKKISYMFIYKKTGKNEVKSSDV